MYSANCMLYHQKSSDSHDSPSQSQPQSRASMVVGAVDASPGLVDSADGAAVDSASENQVGNLFHDYPRGVQRETPQHTFAKKHSLHQVSFGHCQLLQNPKCCKRKTHKRNEWSRHTFLAKAAAEIKSTQPAGSPPIVYYNGHTHSA